MASFPYLEGLVVAANFMSLFHRMMLYFERETSIDFDFAADLQNLWVQFIDRTNDRKLFISELDGLPPSVMSYNCCQFLQQVQENDFIKLLELRKMIAETYREVHKKLDFVSYSVTPPTDIGDDVRRAQKHMLEKPIHHNINQITKVDPPVGLFVNHIRSLFESDFVPLDPRLRSKKSAMDKSFSRGSIVEADNVKILQSCNGLLLCGGSGMPVFYYVYNPSTNQYKKIPYADCSLDNSPYYSSAGLRIAFDPTKSPHYKLVDAGRTFCDIDIQIYSSETGKWSLCRDRFNYFSFDHFDSAIYWNDGLHWLETENRQLMHYCLNIEDPDHPNITTIPIPQRGMTFLNVHTDDFMTPLPEGWSIRFNVWSIVLREREQDSFLVIKLSRKVVQYNLISKTLHEIYDCGSNQLDDNHDDDDDANYDDDELLQQFQAEHNVYEFIPSFASV
ncbi:hypothetical protein Tco_1029420 [Tanacetum coccineum]|uniref:F-box protein At3g26010-like beta-propeller domain-containing protein n=1 Tax=Tanacetum coccineum TaxID=301880 RepID=A0ABQ5G3D8_9ASTR